MYCPKCGKENADDAALCNNCGTSRSGETTNRNVSAGTYIMWCIIGLVIGLISSFAKILLGRLARVGMSIWGSLIVRRNSKKDMDLLLPGL